MILRLSVVGFLVAASSPCWADTSHASPLLRALHVGGGLALPVGGSSSFSNPGWMEVDLGAGIDLWHLLELEAGIAFTPGGSRLVRGTEGEGQEALRTRVGTLARTVVHAGLGGGSWRPVAGAGVALVFGGDFGVVPLAQLEAGIERRQRHGLYLMAALRAYVPLASSRPELSPSRCLTADCPSQFDLGKPILGSRVAIGIAF